MKITVAMDSFKGSLSSMMAGQAVSDGILRVYPEAEVQVRPLADGGEGTVEALVCGMGGKEERITVTGPVGEPVECSYGMIEKNGTAVIEMSGAAGITLVPEKEQKSDVHNNLWRWRSHSGCRAERLPKIHHWNWRKRNQ